MQNIKSSHKYLYLNVIINKQGSKSKNFYFEFTMDFERERRMGLTVREIVICLA